MEIQTQIKEEIIQQLSQDYDIDFVTLYSKKLIYPKKVNLTNPLFITVKDYIQMQSIKIIYILLETIYKEIRDKCDFMFQQHSNINNSIKNSETGKINDILTRTLWALYEFKNGHNKNFNAKYFSQHFLPVYSELFSRQSLIQSQRKHLILEKTNLTSVNTSTEHAFPNNIIKKLLLHVFHIQLQKQYQKDKVLLDLLNIMHILSIIVIIPEEENKKLNSKETGLQSSMPTGFYNSNHQYYLDPWARYRETNILVHEYVKF